ncbi:hypothetical protein SAMN05444680_10930 [Variovorax sp. YR216]|nr:hypothetical protein SAMN05444680_10930 [Variovorax sp. YR216]
MIASALALALAACGGGGGGGFVPAPAPAAAAPAPVAAPPAAPAEVAPPAPAPAAPKTWKDTDCSRTGSALPACSTEFSDNSASATIVINSAGDAIQLATVAAPLAAVPSPNNGIKGNKAVYGVSLLHKLKLADYPGISLEAKLNTGDTTIQDDLYVTTTVSLTCDGANWLNLITMTRDMTPVALADGWARYTATPAQVKWYRTGTKPFPTTGTVLLNGAIGTGGGALSLDALMAAYPDACVWNFPNPNAGKSDAVTPALAINLGDSGTTTNKKAWLRAIAFGDKVVF